jgi:hypothetical protein
MSIYGKSASRDASQAFAHVFFMYVLVASLSIAQPISNVSELLLSQALTFQELYVIAPVVSGDYMAHHYEPCMFAFGM